MPDVMSLGSLTKPMGTLAYLAKTKNACSTARTIVLLSRQRLLLGTKSEFAGSLWHPRTSQFI